jgi:hypothetical protein
VGEENMKKSLAIGLIVLLMMAVTGTAFAASASFSDVPAKHWAYDSVTKLVQAGLIEGYGDGTFKGDKTLTRYEFAFLVAKAMDRYDGADAANKAEIDKLSAEFASELNKLGARMTKVEAKTNTWVSGDTRMRWVTDSPHNGAVKLRGSDNFDFRQRIMFRAQLNDKMTWAARLSTAGNVKAGNNDQASGSDISLDLMNVTMNNVLGLDTIRIGRSAVDYVANGGMIGRPGNSDGLLIKNKFGGVQFTGYTGNTKTDGTGYQGTAAPGGDAGNAYTFTTGQLGFSLSKDLHLTGGYYWADIPGTSTSAGKGSMNTNVGSYDQSKGVIVGLDYKIGQYTLLADYLSTSLVNAVGVPKNPKGWAVQFSNSKGPKVFFPAVLLVDPKKVGTDSYLVGYRSADPGTAPQGINNYDTTGVAYASQGYNVFTHGNDNVNVLYLAYQNVLAKNFVLTLEYQDYKINNRALTGLTSDNLDKTYMMKFEFFY